MEEIETTAFIDTDGKLQINHRDKFIAAISGHPNTAGTLKFLPHSNRVTHNQRKYFFGVVVKIIYSYFQAIGDESVKKVHVYNFLKERFLFREEMCPITNRFIKVYMSLGDNEAGMNHSEFTEKKEQIQQWCSEKFDLYIPDPDPNWKMYRDEKDKIVKE